MDRGKNILPAKNIAGHLAAKDFVYFNFFF